jgi:hypothetical protein
MEEPQVTRVLKRDQFGSVELMEGPAGRVVRRIACGCAFPGTGLVARLLLRRERRALLALAGLPGVARALELPPYEAAASIDGTVPDARDVLLRSWVAGTPLHAADRLPENYFELLEVLVVQLHRRGVCHNDLHKEPNVIVGPDGRPGVIDFQLASIHSRAGRGFATRMREDLRHVVKHRKRYLTGMGLVRGEGAGSAVPRRSFLAAAWMRSGKPLYNFVTRRLLRTADGEPRRPSAGPWPRSDPPLASR